MSKSLQLKLKVLELDPYKIVQAELDAFSPYCTIQLPCEMQDEMHSLDDFGEFDEWLYNEYLATLQDAGARSLATLKEEIKKQLDKEIDEVLLNGNN
jgi:hypothetical protein